MSRFTKKKFGSATANRHIAEITGQRYHHRPFAWVDGDSAYSHITGGIIMPTFDQPGYLLTVGVRHKDQKFDCLDEFEHLDEKVLYQKAKEIQNDYGQGVVANWWGDPSRLMSLVNQENIKAEFPVFISHPADFNEPDAFQIYIVSLGAAISSDNKTLFLNECHALKNHIMAFVPEKSRQDQNLALHLAGSLVHTLNIYRPWEHVVETIELIPTSHEDFAAYDNKKAIEALERELYA